MADRKLRNLERPPFCVYLVPQNGGAIRRFRQGDGEPGDQILSHGKNGTLVLEVVRRPKHQVSRSR